MEKIISGRLYNDPFATEPYWTLTETATGCKFKVISSQNEKLNTKVNDTNNGAINFYSREFKAKRISEYTVEVILE